MVVLYEMLEVEELLMNKRLTLECIELIINTAKWTKVDVKYWMKERSRVLKLILKEQIKFW